MQAANDLVLDTNVFVAGLLAPGEFREPQSQRFPQHAQAKPYTDGIATGAYRVHVPRLCLIEICTVMMRELKTNTPQSRWVGLMRTFQQWSSNGRIVLHNLDQKSMAGALKAAVKYKTRGADTTFVALADQLSIPIKTFDKDILAKYPQASVP